jgi:hypothetical protein
MQIKVKISSLRQTRWYEYAIRFALGGIATAITGVIAKSFGSQVAGLFLAFPAIFFASATLVEKHERERKEKIGFPGRVRGKDAAALDAAGAALGSVSLGVFAILIWLLARPVGVFSLLIALVLWMVTALLLWRFRRRLR